jgi:hypothetical protein
MTIAYIRPINPPGELQLVEIIGLSPGSPPPRPQPQPPGGNWSPIHPEHPIANPWPPYVDVSPPLPQPEPPDPGEPPVIPSGPPVAGQLPQSEIGGWMYCYNPQYQVWLWAWTGPVQAATPPAITKPGSPQPKPPQPVQPA